MTTTVEPSEPRLSRLESLSTAAKVRFAAFTLVALGILAFAGLAMPNELAMAYTSWFEDFGVHQIHDQMLFAFIWLTLIIPVALMLYHPTERVNAILAPVIFAVPWTILAILADSPILVLGAIFGGLGLVALALHPAGRSLFTFDRVASVDRRVAGLLAVGAVPLLVYSGLELSKQLGPANDHTLFVHYGTMALAAFYVVVMATLAVFRKRDWRFAAWSAGLTAAYLGVLSLAYPAIESSLGLIGGTLLVLWAIAFVASVEYVRRSDGENEGVSIDETGTKPA